MPLTYEIDSSELPTLLRLSLAGSLDTATTPELKGKLMPLVDVESVVYVVFDLERLAFLSSAGLQLFVMVQKRLHDRDGKVLMLNMQPQIAKVFEIVRAMDSFAIFSSDAEMDRYLESIQAEHKRAQ
jgi:anti-anti-sigma factor